MSHNSDANEDALAAIDLRVWHVPPPAAVDPRSLLVRALSPAATPAKRPRIGWVIAAIVLLNAAIATVIVILLARPPAAQTTVAIQPAGGGATDHQLRDVLQRLELEKRELERKLAEIQELRALIVELSEKLRKYEQQDEGRERTVPKQRDRAVPPPAAREPAVQEPVDPYDVRSDPTSCDEVSCVLTNYEGACCAKFRSPRAQIAKPPANPLPEALDRQAISNGIASVKARVLACRERSTAKGTVRIRVRVSANGLVTSVTVDATPDAALGACVAASVQRAVFVRTQNGGSFSYPFVF